MKRALAVAFAAMLACLPVAAQAEDLFHDDDSFEADILLGADAAYAVQFDAPTAGGYTLDGVSFYLRAAVPGSYPVTIRFWDEALVELPSLPATVDHRGEGWFTFALPAPLPFSGSVRVGIFEPGANLALGSDTTLPADGFSHRFDLAGWSAIAGADLGVRAAVTLVTPAVPAVGCVGFQPPLHRTVKMKKGARNLPLKAQLFDAAGAPMTAFAAAPIVTVFYAAAAGDTPADVSAFVLPAGSSNAGNAFRLNDEGIWRYNLKTKGFTAPGFYSVSLASGDEAAYLVEPTCTAEFVIGTPKQKKPKR